MEIIGFWSTIIKEAKEIGRLREQGKFEEAEELDKIHKQWIRKCDRIILDVQDN